MAGVDVHEIERHRRAHEVSDPEAQQILIECKGRVYVGHHQHRMSHALRPSTETPYVPCRAGWFIGDLTTVESFHTVAGWIVGAPRVVVTMARLKDVSRAPWARYSVSPLSTNS